MTDSIHVALVHGTGVLARERFVVDRLAIGLTGDGERVTRVAPLDTVQDADHAPSSLVKRIEIETRTVPWRRTAPAERVRSLTEKSPPDVVAVRGRDMWRIASDYAAVARRRPDDDEPVLPAPLVVECWRLEDVTALARFARSRPVAAAIAPSPFLADRLCERLGEERVHLVPAGVPVPPRPREILANPDDSVAIAVLGPVGDAARWRGFLTALARVARDRPALHAFVELHGPGAREAWRELRRLDLLSRVSCLEDLARFRRLMIHADLLAVPEPNGAVRSLVLAAMAEGMPVLTAADPVMDMLGDEDTADSPEHPDAEIWSALLSRRLDDPVGTRALGLRGRAIVDRHHRSTAHVTAYAEVLRGVHAAATEAETPPAATASPGDGEAA